MNKNITVNFGNNLKRIRKREKLTQEQLADYLGINWRQVARIEAGESFIKSETLYKLCMIFEIQPSELFDFSIGDNAKGKPQEINIDDLISDFSKQLYSRLNEY